MRKIMCMLLAGVLLGFCACGEPASPAETTAPTIFVSEEPSASTEPPEETSANENTFTPTYAKNSQYFFAALEEDRYSQLYCAALDGSGRPERIPLPDNWEGEELWDVQILEAEEDHIVVGKRTSNEDPDAPWMMFRVTLRDFLPEALGKEAQAPALRNSYRDDALLDELFPLNGWGGRISYDYQTVPRGEYEINSSYVIAPEYIYAMHEGELYRLLRSDISQQQRIALPEKHDGIAMMHTDICGFTQQYMFVSRSGEAGYYDELAKRVIYRVDLNTLQGEFLTAVDSSEPPRYNPEENSLLYLPQKKMDYYGEADEFWVEAYDIDSGKRSRVIDIAVYRGHGEGGVNGWWNLPEDGSPALRIWNGWDSGYATHIIFGQGNAPRLADGYSIPRYPYEEIPAPCMEPRNKAEKSLATREDIVCYATHMGNVYYVQRMDQMSYESNFYRVKTDGSGETLLRAKTNIFELWSEDDRLFCFAGLPDDFNEAYGFYLLNDSGKVAQTIAHGYDGEWACTYIERLDELMLFLEGNHWRSEDVLLAVYDPTRGEVFSRSAEDLN